MFRVALVQNQSEMAHYGYADARPLISDLGYEPVLFTADNIDELGIALERGLFDAVIFGSNALNDKTIRMHVANDEFQQPFHEWLKKGRGCLVLHQLRLAALDSPTVSFLPAPYDALSAVVRPLEEQSAQGTLALGLRARHHILLLYPDSISPESVQQNAIQYRSLPGLYWHSWGNVNLSHWEILLEDPSITFSPRPLVLSLREPSNFRIVVSALTLDWQKQRAFLGNILTYVIEGRHNTAILLDENRSSTAFDYILGTLQSRKFPFRQYYQGQDHERLEQHIINGVHNVLVLGPFVELEHLSESIVKVVNERVADGHLKLVSLEEREQLTPRFTVTGGERGALELLQTCELYVQDELRNAGYIDGSFWSTVETLQELKSLPEAKGDYSVLADEALRLTREHDRDGSYDEVFGVTCALLWLRGTFLGTGAKEANASASWIRKRISRYDSREQALAYLTLSQLNILSGEERQALISLLTSLTLDRLSEMDIVVYLRVALAGSYEDVIPGFVTALKDKQHLSGAWVDLTTTATAVTTLVDILSKSRSGSPSYGKLRLDMEHMVRKGIIHIQDSLERSRALNESPMYPWEGKASTTIKCLHAWLKFDNLIDFPVYELVETLLRYDIQSTSLLSGRQALAVLEALKQDNIQLRKHSQLLSADLAGNRKLAKRSILYFVLGLVILYCATSIVAGLFVIEGLTQLLSVFKTAFLDAWAIHLAILGVIAAYLAIPWERIQERWRKLFEEANKH